MYYILEGKEPKKVDLIKWARWNEKANRHVNKTQITDKIKVSTVFLGLDYSFDGGVPILFETMIFGGDHDEYQECYVIWEEAEAGHKRAVELCTK